MVDPVNASGNVQNLQSGRTQASDNNQKRDEVRDARSSSPRDEVSLSQEALDLVRAQEVAAQTRAQLEQSSVSLGLDPGFEDQV